MYQFLVKIKYQDYTFTYAIINYNNTHNQNISDYLKVKLYRAYK